MNRFLTRKTIVFLATIVSMIASSSWFPGSWQVTSAPQSWTIAAPSSWRLSSVGGSLHLRRLYRYIYIFILYITCHIYYSWRLSSVGGSLHLRRLQIQTLMLRFISHYYQSYVIYTNWLFVFCSYNIIWVMFWIPKYNQKSHTDCFIIYRQWCNPIGNWKYFHLFQFCESVLPGTCPSGNGISWIVWNKKMCSPILLSNGYFLLLE